jgi:hypothetical protein
MAHMIRFTRKGLVIGDTTPVDSGNRFSKTDDLVRDIDAQVCERRASLAGLPQDELCAPERDFGRRYGEARPDGTATRTDWFQRFVETMLLLSFTSLTFVYFM